MGIVRAILARAIRFGIDGLQGPTNEQARERLEACVEELAGQCLDLENRINHAEARRSSEVTGLGRQLAEAVAQRDERDACLDALSEHVSPDATADTPRMVRPSSVLAGIRSLQGRLRDARSDLREHDAALEAAVERRSEEADASTELARAILNAVPGEDIVSAARRTMASLARSVEKGEALRYDLSTIVAEVFGPQPVMTHEELVSFLDVKIRERTRDTAAHLARAEKAEAERDDLRARLETAERLHSEAEAQVECRNALRYRIASLEADLTAARDRIAELEAPLPEATVEELVLLGEEAMNRMRGLAPYVTKEAKAAAVSAIVLRLQRERPPCLIARAVAGGVDVVVRERDGKWDIAVEVGCRVSRSRFRRSRGISDVPASEVRDELARMLTEVGA